MPQTAALRKRNQRARDRAKLGNDEYLRIEREKMRAYRAKKNPKPPKPAQPPPQPQPQPVQPPQPPQPQANKPSKQKQKAPQQAQRAPQQVIKDYVPMYKSPNATPISDNSISTYLSQFKKVYEHFTKRMYQQK